MNLTQAQEHFGVREWGVRAPLAVRILRHCVENEQGCWLRTTGINRRWGYSHVNHHGVQGYAHRWMYELMVGPIPEGLVIDHLCHGADLSCSGGNDCLHRRCCNPSHLEPVPHLINVRRGSRATKTHCPQGHPYDEMNTYVIGDGRGRRCRACAREWQRQYAARRNAA